MTLADIAPLLDPVVSEDQLARIINQLPGLQPVGTEATGRPGPPRQLFDVDTVMELHARLAMWLGPGPHLGRRHRRRTAGVTPKLTGESLCQAPQGKVMARRRS